VASELGVAIDHKGKQYIGYIVLISWVDDVHYFGSDGMADWYGTECVKLMPVVIEEDPDEIAAIPRGESGPGSADFRGDAGAILRGSRQEVC
jgi:hypothetical protein